MKREVYNPLIVISPIRIGKRHSVCRLEWEKGRSSISFRWLMSVYLCTAIKLLNVYIPHMNKFRELHTLNGQWQKIRLYCRRQRICISDLPISTWSEQPQIQMTTATPATANFPGHFWRAFTTFRRLYRWKAPSEKSKQKFVPDFDDRMRWLCGLRAHHAYKRSAHAHTQYAGVFVYKSDDCTLFFPDCAFRYPTVAPVSLNIRTSEAQNRTPQSAHSISSQQQRRTHKKLAHILCVRPAVLCMATKRIVYTHTDSHTQMYTHNGDVSYT